MALAHIGSNYLKVFLKVGMFYSTIDKCVCVSLFLVKLFLGELKVSETAYRKQEAESSSPSDHHPDNQSASHRTNHFLVRILILIKVFLYLNRFPGNIFTHLLGKRENVHGVICSFLV